MFFVLPFSCLVCIFILPQYKLVQYKIIGWGDSLLAYVKALQVFLVISHYTHYPAPTNNLEVAKIILLDVFMRKWILPP